MRIPDTVKIGGIVYDVLRVSQTRLELQAEGNINFREQRITICDTGKEYAKITFLHECVHGMLEALGHTAGDHDEVLVDGLAHQLYQLLEDNPQLLEKEEPDLP